MYVRIGKNIYVVCFLLRLLRAVRTQFRHIPGTQQTICTGPIAQMLPPTRRACATHPFCAVMLWLVFIRPCVPRLVFPSTFFVLLHRAQTTSQTTISTEHRACLPPASYTTTTLLPGSSSCCSNSSGHTLRVSMIVLRKLLCVVQHCHCSSRAQHSGAAAAAGRVLRLCMYVEDPRCTPSTTDCM